MNEYKVFVASSMAEEKLRKELREGIESLNQDFSNFNASLTPLIVGDGLQATGGINTQDDYYDKIISSDFFILFVRNGNTVGDKSYKEYKTAVEQYRNTGRPFVKVYVLKENDAEVDVKLKETGEDFEQLVGQDGRYLDYVTKIKDEHGKLMDIDTSFIIRVKDYLKKIICYEPHTSKSQNELSYKEHIANSRQSRDCEAKYFTREYLDGRINSILNNYSLVILDGSAYSGKTRAAYNLMTNREEWKDAKFYVFNGNNNLSLDALGRLSPNTSGKGSNTVYFIDDINDVIANSIIEDRDNKPFFRFISEYVRNEGRVKYPKTTIIISVSGKMSEEQKQKFYENLFGLPENVCSYESHLKNFIVKFDIYDKRSFIALLSEMKRHGYFFDYKLRPGNYTIGSIFVKENEIKKSIEIIVNNENDKIRVLQTIYSHWMFRHYMDGYYSADFEELKALYSNKEDENCKLLDDIIEELRKKGLLVKEENRISIDVYVIDAIKALYYKFKDSMSRLMNFAENNVDWSSARMAYCLCDKKNFSVEQLLKLLSYLNYKYFNIKRNDKINVPESLCKLLSKSSEDFYLKIFCGKFFSCLPNYKIKEYLAEIESNANDEKYKELYKIVVYALFSKDRTFTLSEEREYLSRIFDDNGNMKEPFNIKDLKNIHNLKRLTPYLKKTAKEIIELAINAKVDGWEQPEESSSDFSWGQDENSDSSNLMYIKQLGLVIIEALHKSADFDDFKNCISDIKESTLECVKQAVSHKLSSFLYKQIDKIAKNFSSEDRKKLFDFILNINDKKGVFDSEQNEWEHSYKVYALNKLLPLMNENDAVAAYRQMQEKNEPNNITIDSYSLSMLMNNPLLNYEDLLPFAEEYSESEDSFIIFNHLMKKVKTKSDADYVCRSLMGVRRPSDLKDQNAFGAYMEIKHIRSLDAVRLIKDWKKKFEGKCLSSTSVNIFLGKLNFWHLKRLLVDTDITKEIYEADYGLDYEKEIEPARLNPICISRLLDKLSTSASQALKYKIKNESKIQEIKEATDAIFNDIMVKDKGLIIDDMRNGNATLLSTYMKNGAVFPSYKDLYEWSEKFIKTYNIKRRKYTYTTLLWAVKDQYKDTKQLFAEVEKLLLEAYRNFSDNMSREEVISNMSALYSYYPKFVDKNKYDEKYNFVYEDKVLKKLTFKEYLDYISKNESSYADKEFIKNSLLLISHHGDDGRGIWDEKDEKIFKLLCDITFKTHNGAEQKIINHHNLSECVKQRLVDCYMGNSVNPGESYSVNPGESYIIQNFSKVEYLVSKFAEKELNVVDLENSIKKHRIKITQTLLNTIFKGYKGKDKVSYDDYQMLLEKYCPDNKSGALTRSIYMLLPMLEFCRSNEEWEGTLKLFPDVDKNSVEIYDISVRKMFDFYIQDKENPNKEPLESFLERVSADIENNRERVGVYAINSCLARFVLILENRRFSSSDSGIENIKARMTACWENLNSNGKINVCSLLGLSSLPDEPAWEIDADVRTYTFFPMFYDGCMPVYLDEKFKGNFSYDDRQKNDCFYDCLKNYAMKFRDDNSVDSEENYKKITEILLRDGRKNVVRQIFTDFIIRRYNEKKQNCVHNFWYGLLKWSDELKIMLVEGFLKNKYPSLDESNEFDKQRIDLLCKIYKDCSESVKAVVKRTKDAVYEKKSAYIKSMYNSLFFELHKE